jgi:hypothetical protein
VAAAGCLSLLQEAGCPLMLGVCQLREVAPQQPGADCPLRLAVLWLVAAALLHRAG